MLPPLCFMVGMSFLSRNAAFGCPLPDLPRNANVCSPFYIDQTSTLMSANYWCRSNDFLLGFWWLLFASCGQFAWRAEPGDVSRCFECPLLFCLLESFVCICEWVNGFYRTPFALCAYWWDLLISLLHLSFWPLAWAHSPKYTWVNKVNGAESLDFYFNSCLYSLVKVNPAPRGCGTFHANVTAQVLLFVLQTLDKYGQSFLQIQAWNTI